MYACVCVCSARRTGAAVEHDEDMEGRKPRKTCKDLGKACTVLPWEVCIHYCAQVLTGSMCVYTSYIVPHAAAAAAAAMGVKPFKTITIIVRRVERNRGGW